MPSIALVWAIKEHLKRLKLIQQFETKVQPPLQMFPVQQALCCPISYHFVTQIYQWSPECMINDLIHMLDVPGTAKIMRSVHTPAL